MVPFTLKCLGTGDGWPDARRGHSAYLYQFRKTCLLIDAGDPVERAYTASGLGPDLVDAIVLSHMHSDHVGGLFMLLQAFWLKNRRKPLPIYLPPGAIAPLRQMLNTVFFFDELLPFRLELHPIQDELDLGGLRVSASRNSHLDGLRARFGNQHAADFSCYSFLLESGRKRVVHSADLGKPEDLEPLMRKPVDLLVCEMAHFEPEELLTFLHGRKIKQAAFIHLSDKNRRRLGAIRRLAARELAGVPHRFVTDSEEVRF